MPDQRDFQGRFEKLRLEILLPLYSCSGISNLIFFFCEIYLSWLDIAWRSPMLGCHFLFF